MNQMKWLMLSLGLVFAASVGMVACGDDDKTECTSNDDCDEAEVCVTATGLCEERCDGDSDCEGDGQRCSNGCETRDNFCFVPCETDGDCAEGFACNTAFCGSSGDGLCEKVIPTSCTDDSECDTDTQVCDVANEVCVAKCSENTECGIGQVCNTHTLICQPVGASCNENTDCGVGETCENGACVPGESNQCEGQGDCYDKGNFFCAATSPMTCEDTSCGVSFNSCSRCTNGPNNGNRDADGPQIFSVSQVSIGGSTNCQNNLQQCQPDAPILCEFKFFAFSPDESDLPSSDLNKGAVQVISGSGKASPGFGVKRATDQGTGLDTYTVRGCFAEGGGDSVGTAVYLQSLSSKRSNTLCASGTKR